MKMWMLLLLMMMIQTSVVEETVLWPFEVVLVLRQLLFLLEADCWMRSHQRPAQHLANHDE